MSNPVPSVEFTYPVTSIGNLVVERSTDKRGSAHVDQIKLEGDALVPTDRFWHSLYARFQFSKSVFRYFSHAEVFDRIADVEANQQIRLCIESNQSTGTRRLLGVSHPAKPLARFEDLVATLESYDGVGVTYANGVVQSSHTPRIGGNTFDISGDKFSNRFILSCPVDGFGTPNLYLSLLRQVCSNGLVGYSRAFRSSIALGQGSDDVRFAIARVLDGFGNDEGYAALRQRFEAAAKSWASVYEAIGLYKRLLDILVKNQVNAQVSGTVADEVQNSHPMIESFRSLTGDVSEIYGIANVDSLSLKRQRTLPVNCTVYDLLNFASELATHHLREQGARICQSWIGSLISAEYDLEGSIDSFGEFKDFFLPRRST